MAGSVAGRPPTMHGMTTTAETSEARIVHARSTSTSERVSARDGTELLVRHWAPVGETWASVLLVHGVAEHCGRYEHVGGQLARAGLDVNGYDQRGFGASGGRPGWLDRWSRNHDDLEDR